MIDVHVHLPFEQARLAGGADAVLAGERQFDAKGAGPVEQVFAVAFQVEPMAASLEADGHLATPAAVTAGPLLLLAHPAGGIFGGSRKEFHVDAPLGHALPPQAAGDLRHHGLRPAQEKVVEAFERQQALDELRALGVVDAAVEQVIVLQFLAEHRNEVQSIHVPILKEHQIVPKHHRGGGLIAVEQCDPVARMALERRPRDGQDRCDAAAGSDAKVMDPIKAAGVAGEQPLGLRHRQPIAGRQGLVGVAAEAAAGQVLDAHLERFAGQAANGISPFEPLAANGLGEGEILAGIEVKPVFERLRHRQAHPHRLLRFPNDRRHLKFVLAHFSVLKWSKGSKQVRQR